MVTSQAQFNNKQHPQSIAGISYYGGQGNFDASGYGGGEELSNYDSQSAQQAKSTNNNEIIFLGFNQDQSCITVGTQTGFKIYQSDPP